MCPNHHGMMPWKAWSSPRRRRRSGLSSMLVKRLVSISGRGGGAATWRAAAGREYQEKPSGRGVKPLAGLKTQQAARAYLHARCQGGGG